VATFSVSASCLADSERSACNAAYRAVLPILRRVAASRTFSPLAMYSRARPSARVRRQQPTRPWCAPGLRSDWERKPHPPGVKPWAFAHHKLSVVISIGCVQIVKFSLCTHSVQCGLVGCEFALEYVRRKFGGQQARSAYSPHWGRGLRLCRGTTFPTSARAVFVFRFVNVLYRFRALKPSSGAPSKAVLGTNTRSYWCKNPVYGYKTPVYGAKTRHYSHWGI